MFFPKTSAFFLKKNGGRVDCWSSPSCSKNPCRHLTHSSSFAIFPPTPTPDLTSPTSAAPTCLPTPLASSRPPRLRCGGLYSVSTSDLERGAEVVHCSGCSLAVRVLYAVIDDDGDDDVTAEGEGEQDGQGARS